MAAIDDLLSTFMISRASFDGGVMSLRQFVGPTLADHRGRIEMPAYAVMVESATSGAFWYSLGEPVGSVQSWLSLASAAPVVANQQLSAKSLLVRRDDRYGTLTVQISDERDDVVCVGVGRCVRVGRTSDALSAIDGAPSETGSAFASPTGVLPPPIDPELDGSQILAEIGKGRISPGPLCELLCATVKSDNDTTQLVVSPQQWMANPLGTMQGGVVTAIVSQACVLAGQRYTIPGQQYSLAGFNINFFRSPPVDGELTVTTTLDKLGQRIGTLSAIMTGSNGVTFARAVADIEYQPAPRLD
ncbi:PaaI family thioesterase [Mycobacterium botniense]|uniref:Thioesterase domain-containing protein n=1 Tax=Mycobacterium botniense TaxID=84962 RepID=A0A7I9XVM3_9MYCO|nr:PaaI family thioesterase [Mycobacterium botniense]GFG73830.1 hypothetical protein MBOT_11950 [Mycobacterium botniense]